MKNCLDDKTKGKLLNALTVTRKHNLLVIIFQRFHDDKLLLHASGNPKHKFMYGFYFYYFTIPSKDKSKQEYKGKSFFQV